MAYSPASVLITGGCGFIGSNFINHVSKHWPAATIVNLDKLMPGANACNIDQTLRSSSRYNLVIGDIKNRELIGQTLKQYNVDTIIHFAANSNVDECYQDPVATTRNNVVGMTHMLEVCRQHSQLRLFVHISSDEVYGESELDADERPKDERTPLRPTNTYAATKASCEALLNAYKISYKLPAITIRMNNVYGRHQWVAKGPNVNMVVPCFIKEAENGQPFTLMQGGKLLRSWMYVDDCCKGIRMITEKGRINEVYNLGTSFELSILDLSKAIHEEVGKQLGKSPAQFTTVDIDNRPYNDRRYFIDTSKVEKEIGWKCETPFAEGLAKTVAWYLTPALERQGERVLLYGGKGWIGEQFCELLADKRVPYVLGSTRPGSDLDERVEEELVAQAPSHIICVTGRTHGPGCGTIQYLEGGPDKLMENVRDNMYGPWVLAALCRKLGIHLTYIGTGCLYKYEQPHPVGGQGYTEEDQPNYFGMSYSVVKGYTDRIMHHYEDIALNARIRLPVNFQMDKRNLLAKIINYASIFDIPNSITILPDILPLMYELMQKRYTGTLNMTNPGAIRHSFSLKLYKQLVDPTKSWTFVHEDEPQAAAMRESRSNCALDTTKLQTLFPKLRTAEQAMKQAVEEVGKKMAAEKVGNGQIQK